MSLFQAREWWTTQASGDEEYTFDALAVGNVDNSPDGAVKIVTGSIDGMLRVYGPVSRLASSSDLVLEASLGVPILQVEVGVFVRGSPALALAVLTPHTLTVYRVSQQADYASLDEVYTHPLSRPASSFAYGPFGGAQGRDSIVVLTLDGQLVFFDQDVLAFAAFVPFLVPGPMVYLSLTDTLVLGSSDMGLHAYTYASLAAKAVSAGSSAAAGASDSTEQERAASGRRLVPSWTLNLGQHPVQLAAARFSAKLSPSQSDIVVLGTSSLFCVSERGELRSERRLDMAPLCMAPYVAREEGTVVTHNVLVASAAGSVSVYSGSAVEWAAKLPAPAVALSVGTFGGLRGLIVSLSAAGAVSLLYLGTDPSVASLPGAGPPPDADFAALEKEMRKLNATAAKSSAALAAAAAAGDPAAPADQPPLRTPPSLAFTPQFSLGSSPASVACKLDVSLAGARKTARSAVLRLSLPSGVSASCVAFDLDTLMPGSAKSLSVEFSVALDAIPASLKVAAALEYVVGKRSEPRSCVGSFALPLALVAAAAPPQQASAVKYTLSTPDHGPVDAASLFPLLYEASEMEAPVSGTDAAGVMTVLFTGAGTPGSSVTADAGFATLLVSNKDGKYRVVANDAPMAALVIEALPGALHRALGTPTEPALLYKGKPPLDPVFTALDARFAAQCELRAARAALAAQSESLRNIEKRMLTRFTARNPEPVDALSALFDSAFQQVVMSADVVQTLALRMGDATRRLTYSMHLLITLMASSRRLPAATVQVLTSLLVPPSPDDPVGMEDQVEWEAVLAAGLRHLVSTVLAESLAQAQLGPSSLAVVDSLDELKQHLALLVERVGPDTNLVPP